MNKDFVSSGRSVSDLKAHLVLTSKYRKDVFTGEMIERLKDRINPNRLFVKIRGIEPLIFTRLSSRH